MSVAKDESLKSGKLNIIQVDHSSDIERQKNYNYIVHSTPTKNRNVNAIKDSDDLIVNCTPTKTTNNNKDTDCITHSTSSKNSISGSVASSSGNKEYCEKFFIPLEIRQIYNGFTRSRINAQEIIEYFFDSCSSGEENCESSEINSSDLLSDSNLLASLLRLKKKTKTPWQNNFRRKTRKTSIIDTRCTSARRQNKTFVFSNDKESESVYSDSGQNLSEDRIVETPQLKEKCIDNKTKSNLNKLLLEQFLHIEKQNSVNDSEDNIKISPEHIISAVEKCETGNGETSVLEKNVNEKDSDFETLFIEKTPSVNVKNCTIKENIYNNNSQSPNLTFYDTVKNNNSKENISLYDVTGTELDHSDCNEEDMVKSKDRRNLDRVYSKTVESLNNTDNELNKSFSKLHKEPDSSENVDSIVLHDEQYSLSSVKNIKKNSSNPIKIYTHYSENFSDTEQFNENKKLSPDNNQNLNGASHKNNSMNQDNKFNKKERKMEDDKTVSYRNSSVEKDKQNIAATIKYNRHKERRSVYDISENSDSDTDKRSINKSIFSKNIDIVANSDSKNNCSDQENSNQTSTGYVIKLSSDNDSEASDKRNIKTFKPVSFNRTVDHHVSVPSNDNNSDISDNEKRPVSTYEKIESINQIKNNLLIDFNEDFLRRNEVWLVQCPKNMNMGNIKGQSLNVPSRTVVHDHGCKYECYVHQNNTLQQTVNLAVPHKLHKFSLMSYVCKNHQLTTSILQTFSYNEPTLKTNQTYWSLSPQKLQIRD